MSNKLILSITICFILFFCFILYAANTGQELIFFKLVKALPMGDKIGHFSLMFMLTFLINLALKHRMIGVFKIQMFLGSLIVFSLISIEECSQIGINRRTFDVIDLLFNYMGIGLASWVSLRLRSKILKTKL